MYSWHHMVSKGKVFIGVSNGLLPLQRHDTTWTNIDLFSNWPLETNVCRIGIKIQKFSTKNGLENAICKRYLACSMFSVENTEEHLTDISFRHTINHRCAPFAHIFVVNVKGSVHWVWPQTYIKSWYHYVFWHTCQKQNYVMKRTVGMWI